MRTKFIFVLALPFLLLAGCATDSNSRSKDPNYHKYYADLDGDGATELVETDDKTKTESKTLVTVKKNKKNAEVIDDFSVPAKIRKIDFVELTMNEPEKMVIHFDSSEDISNIVIYQLKDNKLIKIFNASSKYGIDANFDAIARIRVGKAPKEGSSNSTPEWETWTWCGDKFIKE